MWCVEVFVKAFGFNVFLGHLCCSEYWWVRFYTYIFFITNIRIWPYYMIHLAGCVKYSLSMGDIHTCLVFHPSFSLPLCYTLSYLFILFLISSVRHFSSCVSSVTRITLLSIDSIQLPLVPHPSLSFPLWCTLQYLLSSFFNISCLSFFSLSFR